MVKVAFYFGWPHTPFCQRSGEVYLVASIYYDREIPFMSVAYPFLSIFVPLVRGRARQQPLPTAVGTLV